jgi:Tfp pilus assembly protein PilF
MPRHRSIFPLLATLALALAPGAVQALDGDLPSPAALEAEATRAIERGFRAMRVGAFEDALDAYHEALAHDPTRMDARLGAGAALEGLGRPREAAQAYDRAVRQRPGDADARARLVRVLGQLTPDEALTRLGELASAHPADPDVTEAIGLLLLRQGRPLAALGALEHTATLDPSSPARWHNMAVAADRAGQADKAITAYRRAVSLARAGGSPPPGMDLAALSRRARWLETRIEEGAQ